jgi:PhnB protein
MQITSYLFFDGSAAEAFDFYARCLGGKITMKVTFGDMPESSRVPANLRDRIAHVGLEAGGAQLMASDWCPPDGSPYPGIHGNRVCLGVDDPGEAERLFAALSQGGDVMMPLAETSWSLRFGMFTDRYGAHWMVNCNRPSG